MVGNIIIIIIIIFFFLVISVGQNVDSIYAGALQ
jgi:hypothetical protein